MFFKSDFIFQDLDSIVRMCIAAFIVYAAIVAMVKISGKRSTSQFNNFDWIVTVMMGSIGASTIILTDLPVANGIIAMVTLMVLQYIVTKYASISPSFANFILSEPRVVFYDGQFLPDAMRQERLTVQELECAMRESGIHSHSEVAAIVLESDAKLTVIPHKDDKDEKSPFPIQSLNTLNHQ